MGIRSRVVLGLGLGLLAAACGDLTTPQDASVNAGESTPQANYARAETGLRHVARSVAMALERKEVRLAVRDAMRDSPWDVHQLVLQEYTASREGRGLLLAAARAAGETPEAFQARLAALPELDFYVPDREHRRTWRGSAGVTVAASLNAEERMVFGYGPGGQEVPDALTTKDASRPVMLLHPAEPRGRRNVPQPTGIGDVIQSAQDGEDAVSFTWIAPDGKKTVVQGHAALAMLAPRRSVTGTPTGQGTYLDWVDINFTDPGDDAEITVYAKFYDPAGLYLGEGQYSNYNLKWLPAYDAPGVRLFTHMIPDSSSAVIQVRVREDDADDWGNPDDWFGPRNFTWQDRDEMRSVYNTGNDIVNIELDWIRRPAPVLRGVVVTPVFVNEGQRTQAGAYATDQYGYGMPGYSVSNWRTDDPGIAHVDAWGVVTGVSTGYTGLYATIGGITGSAPLEVGASCYPRDVC